MFGFQMSRLRTRSVPSWQMKPRSSAGTAVMAEFKNARVASGSFASSAAIGARSSFAGPPVERTTSFLAWIGIAVCVTILPSAAAVTKADQGDVKA